jgi:hypothetical protein
MELSPSWEAESCAANQELPNILWNPEFHYRVHKSLLRSLSWARSLESIPSHPISLRSILISSSNQRLGLPSALFFFWLLHQYYIPILFIFSFTHALPTSFSLILRVIKSRSMRLVEHVVRTISWTSHNPTGLHGLIQGQFYFFCVCVMCPLLLV